MGTLTYLQYTNRVLEDINETTLSALSSSRGIQTVVKNSVNRAINDIANSEVEWPFLHSDKEQDTYASVAEYALPSDHSYVDFDSFMLFPKNLVTNGTFDSNITNWTDGSSGTGAIGFNSTGPLDPSESRPIGNIGTCSAMTASEMSEHLSTQLGRPILHLAGGPNVIQTVGWCSGGAQGFLEKAAAQHCDAYISGEVSEKTFHEAAELGVHYFACGHHATERGGVMRLGQAIAKQFGILVEFIDIPSPV